MESVRNIRGFYEWLCAIVLALIAAWLVFAFILAPIGRVVIPIVWFLLTDKVLEW